jgi:hypothetical protein
MAYKSVQEIEIFNKSGAIFDDGTPVTQDTDLASGGPYKILGYRYTVVSTASVTSCVLAFEYYDGTNVWEVVNKADADQIVLVAAISGATTVRKQVWMRSNNDCAKNFIVKGTYRTSFTFNGTLDDTESATVHLLVERQVT